MFRHIFILILTSFIGCDNNILDYYYPDGPIEYEELNKAGGFNVDSAFTIVIKGSFAYSFFVSKYWGINDGSGKLALPPQVDFSKEMILGIFGGDKEQVSGCSPISRSIDSIYADKSKIIVEVGPLEPLGPCLEIQYPIYMVKIIRSDYQVKFIGQIPGK